MADDVSMARDELLRTAQLSEDVDFLREGVLALAQALMEVEVTQHLGAGRSQRTGERSGERHGWVPQELAAACMKDVQGYSRGRKQADDQTLMVVRLQQVPSETRREDGVKAGELLTH